MGNNTNVPKPDFKDNLLYIKNLAVDVLKEINPWTNIKIMHTNISQDIMAGIVVAIVALPLALAFGVGSGLGAITGIWGAIAGGIIGGIFGGSIVGVSGPTGPKMVQLAAIMVGYRLASGEPDLGVAFSIIFFSGLILVVLSFLKVSRLIYYTPYSVVAGFMCGIGVIVMLLEFNPFLGLPAPSSIMEAIVNIPYAVMNASPQALIVAVPTLLILFLWPKIGKWVPLLKKFPSPLIALLLGTGIANYFQFDIDYIGEIPLGLPDIYLPDWSRFGEFFIPALSLAGLAVFDSLLTCVVADHMIGEKHSSDRETFGQGLANIVAGLIGGLTTATATMRTVANIQSGGRTPLAAVTHGVVLMTLVLGLGFLAESIPMACLAAILFKVGIDILDYRIIPVLHRLPLTDMIVFWLVLVVTIFEDLLVAMAVGIVLAFFRFVQEMSRIYKHQVVYLDNVEKKLIADEVKNKIKVLKPQGPLFFGSIEPLETTYQQADKHDILVIDLSGVTMVDLSGAYALEDLIIKAKSDDKDVFVCNAPPKVEDLLRRINVIDHIGERSFFSLAQDAIVQAQEMELVRLAHKRIIDQAGEVLLADDHHEQMTDAVTYAHDTITDPKKRKIYDEGEEYKKVFSKAAEDFLIGPEIHKMYIDGYDGKEGHTISCIVTDNFKVHGVDITITCLDGREIESGKAYSTGAENRWNYITKTDAVCEKGVRILVNAQDLPGNKSSKDIVLNF